MVVLLNLIFFRFPPKEDVIDFAVRTAKRYLQKEPKTLIVVGAYSIGKENVYLAISKALQVLQIWDFSMNFWNEVLRVLKRKKKILVGSFLTMFHLMLCYAMWPCWSSNFHSQITHLCLFLKGSYLHWCIKKAHSSRIWLVGFIQNDMFRQSKFITSCSAPFFFTTWGLEMIFKWTHGICLVTSLTRKLFPIRTCRSIWRLLNKDF